MLRNARRFSLAARRINSAPERRVEAPPWGSMGKRLRTWHIGATFSQ